MVFLTPAADIQSRILGNLIMGNPLFTEAEHSQCCRFLNSCEDETELTACVRLARREMSRRGRPATPSQLVELMELAEQMPAVVSESIRFSLEHNTYSYLKALRIIGKCWVYLLGPERYE